MNFSWRTRLAFTILTILSVGVPISNRAQAQITGPPAKSAVQAAPLTDTSFIDSTGTAHVTRVIPVPTTISEAAQRQLARQVPDTPGSGTLADRRRGTDRWQSAAGKHSQELYPVNIADDTIAGVPVRVITPVSLPPGNGQRVLINLHGGGFNSDSGSLTETIPIANLTKIKVVAVLYRLAPEHPFPAGLDDAIAVYRELLKTYKPHSIGIYGTSAGAILTAEVAVKLRQLHLPEPGALGIFSGMGDFSRRGDSQAMYSLTGLSGHLDTPGDSPDAEHHRNDPYLGKTAATDPVLSPVYADAADLKGLPPTLFVTSGRDLLLSGTTILHRAFLRAGVDARLVVFEALPHAFWNDPDLPESKEADKLMASFFQSTVGGQTGN